MNSLVLGLGSNSIDKIKHLQDCIDWLGANLDRFVCSSTYETAALNGKSDPYLNAVAIGQTEIDLETLHNKFKEYEEFSGRKNEDSNIIIDIDIVMWNNSLLRPTDFHQQYFQIGWKELRDNH